MPLDGVHRADEIDGVEEFHFLAGITGEARDSASDERRHVLPDAYRSTGRSLVEQLSDVAGFRGGKIVGVPVGDG